MKSTMLSSLRHGGIRQLPGIYRYPAKGTAQSREYKVAPRISFYSSLTEELLCQGRFYFPGKGEEQI